MTSPSYELQMSTGAEGRIPSCGVRRSTPAALYDAQDRRAFSSRSAGFSSLNMPTGRGFGPGTFSLLRPCRISLTGRRADVFRKPLETRCQALSERFHLTNLHLQTPSTDASTRIGKAFANEQKVTVGASRSD